MEQNRLLGAYERAVDILSSKQSKKVIAILVNLIGGFMFSRGLAFGRFTPFGIAAVAAAPKENMWAAFIGVFIGKVYGMTLGIILGILLDFFIGKAIGINGIMLGIAGILRGNTCKKFFKK